MKKSLDDVIAWAVRYVPGGPQYVFIGKKPPGRTHEMAELIPLVPLDSSESDCTLLDNEDGSNGA